MEIWTANICLFTKKEGNLNSRYAISKRRISTAYKCYFQQKKFTILKEKGN
jgi:hypothetical protein